MPYPGISRAAFLFVAALLWSTFACSPAKKTVVTPASPTRPAASAGTRAEVADYAQKFVGTTYKYGGTNPATGFDCSGFTSFVLRGFGVDITPASKGQAKLGREVALDRVQAGDLLFFAENGRDISHVALVVRRDASGVTCVHSTTSRGVIVENVTASAYWKPKILFARDVLGKR